MKDILHPFGSLCRFKNECATSPRKATDKQARMNDIRAHPLGRILTRPSRKLGLLGVRCNKAVVSSVGEESSPSYCVCRIDDEEGVCDIRRGKSVFICCRNGEVI